jgi:hypothetical protein
MVEALEGLLKVQRRGRADDRHIYAGEGLGNGCASALDSVGGSKCGGFFRLGAVNCPQLHTGFRR